MLTEVELNGGLRSYASMRVRLISHQEGLRMFTLPERYATNVFGR